MGFYSEREELRNPIIKTDIVDPDAYALLFDCCERYFNAIAWKYPSDEVDVWGCSKLDVKKLIHALKIEIPDLYGVRSYCSLGWFSIPEQDLFSNEVPNYNQYALLDFIEFIYRDCRDIKYPYESPYRGLGADMKRRFKKEINECFKKTGLQYKMVSQGKIERILDDSALSKAIIEKIKEIPEKGIKDLLNDAIIEFRKPSPKSRQHAVELIWDAFERLKTYYTELDKKKSSEKIVNDMAGGKNEFIEMFNAVFNALTDIGNKYRIRHHETDKVDITDIRHYDYFFNRCLALIATAILYLK